MPHEFKVTRRVEFSDTDMAGLMHYSNYFRFMETAEHAFYRELGFSVVLRDFDPPLGFPRVHASCDYKKPLHFEDVVEIHLLVKEKRAKSVSYLFRFRNLTKEPAEEVARGAMTIVCVTRSGPETLVAAPIPARVAALIEVAPAHLLT